MISPVEPTLEDQIREAQANDKLCQETIKLLNEEARASSKISLAHCAVQDGLLTYRGKVWIPEEVRAEAVKEVHVQPMVGHTGIGRTLTLLTATLTLTASMKPTTKSHFTTVPQQC